VVIRVRYLLAAALGLCSAHLTPAQEPGRLGLNRVPALPTVSANQQLANTIALQLKESGHLRNYRVELACRDGVVEVCGNVTDQTQSDEALRLVQGVPGVERVINRLAVTQGNVIRVQAEKPATPPPLPVLPEPPDSVGKKKEPGTEPLPMTAAPSASQFDLNPPRMPPYAWPTYAPYPNFSRVAYPEAYPYNAFPFIGPLYPFPKVPLGWRSVKLEFEDGYWWFSKTASKHDWWRLKYH
jgi:hypothetical protein